MPKPSHPRINVAAFLLAICAALMLATRDCPPQKIQNNQIAQPQASELPKQAEPKGITIPLSVNENKKRLHRVKARPKKVSQLYDAGGYVPGEVR